MFEVQVRQEKGFSLIQRRIGQNTKSKGQCQHRTTYRADLLPATLTAYSMQVIAPGSWFALFMSLLCIDPY